MRPHHIRDILITDEQIRKRVDALVEEIAAVCRSERLVVIGVLRGSFMFLADLARKFHLHAMHPRIDFMTLESWGSGTESSGTVQVHKDVSLDLSDADVVMVDDILDTGRTLSFAVEHLKKKGARSIRTCVLLNKPACRVVPLEADFTGFVIDNTFVVGYGLDYDSHYRELPFISKVTFTDDSAS